MIFQFLEMILIFVLCTWMSFWRDTLVIPSNSPYLHIISITLTVKTSFQHDFDGDNISNSILHIKTRKKKYLINFVQDFHGSSFKVYEILDIYTLSAQSFLIMHYAFFKTFVITSLWFWMKR